MDINKDIESLEAKAFILKNQKEQERAMIEVLPVRFERNMDAFRRYIPTIYKEFNSYKPKREFDFFCNDNGIPNLLWRDDPRPFYGQDPYLDCKQQIERILNRGSSIQTLNFSIEDNPLEFIHLDFMNEMMHKQSAASESLSPITSVGSEIPLMFMYGVGLGYQISYLYEKCRPSLLFIIEPDMDLFYASLFTFDWFVLLDYINEENLKIHIFLGQNKDDIIQDITVASAKYGSYLSSASVGFWHYKSNDILELIKKTKQEFFFLVSGWGFFDDNIIAMSHTIANVKRNIPFLVKDQKIDKQWEDVPFFIVGNGPSLDTAINILKEYQEYALILSCGSALSALHRAGIKPDIHVQVERTKVVPDSHRILNDSAYLKDILFLSVDVIHPDCAEQFNRIGLAFKGFEPGVSFLDKHARITTQRDILRSANPLVGNTGLATACRLGFKNIYLVGIDNGYKSDSHHHSKLSFYFDSKGKSKEKLSTQIAKKSRHLVPGNFGGEVETTNMMIHSKTVMERLIDGYKDTNFYNCSDGAKINGTKPILCEHVKLSRLVLDKSKLLKNIITEVYKPMNIDLKALTESLRFDLFDDFVDRFILEWDKKFLTKQDIISCMSITYDHLNTIAICGYEYIYRCLIGSINYSFSVILSFLYKFDESDAFYITVNEMIDSMRNYFSSMKEKYSGTLDSIDRKEHGLFD